MSHRFTYEYAIPIFSSRWTLWSAPRKKKQSKNIFYDKHDSFFFPSKSSNGSLKFWKVTNHSPCYLLFTNVDDLKLNIPSLPFQSPLDYKRRVIKPRNMFYKKKKKRRTQNRNYKFMRLSRLFEASLFREKKHSFISSQRLRRSGIMNGRNETSGGVCMCVDLIIFLFLSMEHLLLWLSAKLFVLWFRLCVFFSRFLLRKRVRREKKERGRERKTQKWMKIRKYSAVLLECEHLDSSPDDD